MSVNRGFIFWGLALVTAGAVALAVQLGYIDRGTLVGAWRLWPLVLIAIGLSIILARTSVAILGTVAAALVIGFAAGAVIAVGPGNVGCGGSEPSHLSERSGAFSQEAVVDLRFDCGTLDVAVNDDSSWTIASGGGDTSPDIEADATSLTVSSRSNQWWNGRRQHWNVGLPDQWLAQLRVEANAADTNVSLGGAGFRQLTIHPNAGSVHLDLRRATVDQLDLALNAGSASIVLGRNAKIGEGTLHVNAGSIDMCVDQSLQLLITVKPNLTFSTNLDDSGLARNGDTWSTSREAFVPDVLLTIEGNAGSFNLNPEGGCG
jgi:hypothetical protein